MQRDSDALFLLFEHLNNYKLANVNFVLINKCD